MSATDYKARREAAQQDPRVVAVQEWARDHYTQGADVIVEAFEPDEIAELIEGAKDAAEAIAIARDYCGLRRSVENDVCGYGGLDPLPEVTR